MIFVKILKTFHAVHLDTQNGEKEKEMRKVER